MRILLLILFLAATSLAAAPTTVLETNAKLEGPHPVTGLGVETKRDALGSGKMRVEIGAVGGFPLGIGGQMGLWNIAESPLFARGAVGFLGLGFSAEGELGVLLAREGKVKQYVSVTGGTFDFSVPLVPIVFSRSHGFYAGPQYGLILWKILHVSLGAAYFSSESTGTAFLVVPVTSHDSGILPFGKIGVSWYF